MSVQEVLKAIPAKEQKRFMKTARDSWDDDRYAVMEEMFDGSTPWEAARKRHESGLSKRSQYTLYMIARQVAEEIHEQMGRSIQSYIRELHEKGEVHVHADRLVELRKACADMKWQIKEDVRIQVVSRG